MKKFILGIVSLIALNFVQASAFEHNPDDPMRSKTVSKSFPMEGKDKLNLNNKYGDILIKVWDKREARVDVDIKVYSKDERDAQHLLDEISVDAGKSGDQISFNTRIGGAGGNYGSKTKNGKTIWRREVKVNYIVYMPSSNALNLNNQYGNVNMGSFSGPLNVKVQYGNFSAGNLNGINNNLNVQYGKTTVQDISKAVIKQQYGSGLSLGTVGTLDLDAQYTQVSIIAIKGYALIKQQYGSGLNIGAAEQLDLDAQYVNVKIGTVKGNANIKQQYNNISIESANKLNLKGQYTTVNLEQLNGDANLNVQYDRLTLKHITSGCKSLNVVATYSKVALSFGGNYQADFNVRVSYSGFKYGVGVTSRLVNESGSTKNYTGKIGSGGDAMINVKAEYGAVDFN